MEWISPLGITVSTDPALMDRDQIHTYLASSYWAKNIPRDICMASLDNSLNFSVCGHNGDFIGFGRLVTDHSTFAYLADVFILPTYQGQGFGGFLIDCINDWLDQTGIRTALLLTKDAQSLYAARGWVHPEAKRVMRYNQSRSGFYDDH